MKQITILLISLLLCVGCTLSYSDCPPLNVCIKIQPYGTVSEYEVNEMVKNLEKVFGEDLIFPHTIEILPNKELPDELRNSKKTRYRAMKILDYQKSSTDIGCLTIGYTHKDISATIHGSDDYGILGLSYSPGTVCIVSDYRLRNKADIWKIALHEFIHAYYGFGHCKNDDPHCIMKDAKGKGNISIQHSVCDSCLNYLND